MDSDDNHSTSSSSDVDIKIARKLSNESKTIRPLDDRTTIEANSNNDQHLPSMETNGDSHSSIQLTKYLDDVHLNATISAISSPISRIEPGHGKETKYELSTHPPCENHLSEEHVSVGEKCDEINEDSSWRDALSARRDRRFSSKSVLRSFVSSNSRNSDGDCVGTWPRRKFSLPLLDHARDWISSDAIFSNNMSPLLVGKHMAAPTNGTLRETSQHHSPFNGSKSDIFMAWEEDNFGQLSTQLSNLDKKIQSMTESQMQVDSYNLALQRENSMLRERIAFMEDQVREEETKAKQLLCLERQNSSDKISHIMKEHQHEVDELREKFHQLEMENAKIRLELTKLKSDADKYSFEKIRLEEKLEESQEKLVSMQTEAERYREFSKRKLEDLKKDRDTAIKAMDDMHMEVSELRERCKCSRAESTSNLSNGADTKDDLLIRYREVQELVKRLSLENRDLMEQLEESKVELFTKSVNEGRKLLLNGHSQLGQLSWQVALEECSQQELLFFLTKERETTNHLRDYIDRMLGRILEEYPTLLERPT